MHEQNNDLQENNIRRRVIGGFMFPIAFFPLLALLSYDWHDIPALCIPVTGPSSNLIGAVGDFFAYYGYKIFGLTIWSAPFLFMVMGWLLLWGKRINFGRRTLGLVLFLFSATCLLQLTYSVPLIRDILYKVNIAPNAGGIVGYLVMTKCLAVLLSPFGSAILMFSLMLFSIFIIIGLSNIVSCCARITSWAADREAARDKEEEYTRQQELEAIRRAKEAAKAERLAEKQRIAKEKMDEEAAKQAAKEALALARRQRSVPPAPAEEPQQKPSRSWFSKKQEPATHPAPALQPPAVSTPAPTTASAPGEDKGPYVLPPVTLLNEVPAKTDGDENDVETMGENLINTLKVFDINAVLSYKVVGPVVTQYALTLDVGTRVGKVAGLAKDIQMALQATSLRIQAPIPGQNAVGIEVPNTHPQSVTFREIIDGEKWRNNSQSKYKLPLLLGKDASGKDLVEDLSTMPHLLVAGATGQGKSVCLNSIIMGLLMSRTPEQLRLIMVDPKCVEFTSYAQLPHLLVPIINDTKKVVFGLRWAINEMEKRLKMFQKAKCRNIVDFNTRQIIIQEDMFGAPPTTLGGDADLPRTIPYIVIVIDEVADIMQTAGKDVEPSVARLTALARATGIHLILATQRPDTKIITGTIKSNIPGRIAFKTSSAIDSRTILDAQGSETLIGRGDMLFKTKEGALIRAQGSFISDDEINNVINFIGEHASVQFDEVFAKRLEKIKDAEPEENDEFGEGIDNDAPAQDHQASSPPGHSKDEITYRKALEVIRDTKRASTSHFQRRMGIGYNNAARIIDMLEERGVIGHARGAGPREILQDPEIILAQLDGTQPPSTEETVVTDFEESDEIDFGEDSTLDNA